MTPVSTDYSQDQAIEIVNKMPDYRLAQYIDEFMAQGLGKTLNDERQFKRRAIEKLYKKSNNRPLVDKVKLSLAPTMSSSPSSSMDTANVEKNVALVCAS